MLSLKNTLLIISGITLLSCEMPDLPFSFQNYSDPVHHHHSNGVSTVEPSPEYLDSFAKEQTEHLEGEVAKEAQINLKQGDFSTYINNATLPPRGQCFTDFSLNQEEDDGLTPLEQVLMESDDGFPFELFTRTMPSECGYGYKKLSRSDVTKMCTAIRAVTNGESATCHMSNCTTASFIGIIQLMKARPDWEEKKKLFNCRYKRRFGKAYQEYIKPDGLRKMFKKFKLGITNRIKIKNLESELKKGWPSPGDPILVQRKNLMGHSAMFHSYEYKNNKIHKVCFWSSNLRTQGQGIKCEPISSLMFLDVGKIDNPIQNEGRRNEN